MMWNCFMIFNLKFCQFFSKLRFTFSLIKRWNLRKYYYYKISSIFPVLSIFFSIIKYKKFHNSKKIKIVFQMSSKIQMIFEQNKSKTLYFYLDTKYFHNSSLFASSICIILRICSMNCALTKANSTHFSFK